MRKLTGWNQNPARPAQLTCSAKKKPWNIFVYVWFCLVLCVCVWVCVALCLSKAVCLFLEPALAPSFFGLWKPSKDTEWSGMPTPPRCRQQSSFRPPPYKRTNRTASPDQDQVVGTGTSGKVGGPVGYVMGPCFRGTLHPSGRTDGGQSTQGFLIQQGVHLFRL